LDLIANTRSGIFCQPGCDEASRQADGQRQFDSARDALAAGFRPCKHCKPLQSGFADPDWLELLLGDVEADPARRWHDQDLETMGLDAAAVRRWFMANYGFTFHAYARLRRLGLALRQIQQGMPVNEAVTARGFESESSFREAFTQVFGGPPSAVDRESSIWLDRVATPLGSMIMGVQDSGLCLLEFAEQGLLDARLSSLRQQMGRVFLPGEHPQMQQVRRQLDGYFEGSLRQFSLPLQAPGTAFQEAAWDALRQIPYGVMRSYADIAAVIGHPDAVRAVGGAIGDNRIAIVTPCHRVVASDGELTGYRGGLWRKEYLLALEQAQGFHLT
jgi:AraC family transcriptional regulator of adaptative response/methylated-DNA-[protein]-cysteine methyltransferase